MKELSLLLAGTVLRLESEALPTEEGRQGRGPR